MFRSRRAWAPVGVMLAVVWPALGVDLSKIPRTIAKEPKYESGKPEYCLIAFGPKAEQRFWVVRDGDRVFCDRNRNGDLTDADEVWSKKKPKKKKTILGSLFGSGDDDNESATFKLNVGDKETEATFSIMGYEEGAYLVLSYEPVGYMAAYSDANGKLEFAKSAAKAPIVHFGGPLTLRLDEKYRIDRTKDTEVIVRLGTPGLGAGTFAFRGYQDVPKNVHPQVEIEFPGTSPGDAPIREKFTLDKRC